MSRRKTGNTPQWIEKAINAANESSSCISEGPVRMPWLHLIDPVTGELPKNYKQILAQTEKEQKQKSVCGIAKTSKKTSLSTVQQTENVPENAAQKTPSASMESLRMPWLHLLDPVTGELPKNYKEILAKEDEERKHKSAFAKTSEPKDLTTRNLSTSFKPFRLFNGGELSEPKPNVANKKGSANFSTKSKKRRSSSGSKVCKITNIKTTVTKLQPEKCARKKLFNISPTVTKLIKPAKKNKPKCPVKTTNLSDLSYDSVSLADMSEVEKQLLKQSTQNSQDDSFEPCNISPITSETNVSTTEFVQLETQLQTPKLNVPKPEEVPSPDLRDAYIERFTQIVEQQSKLVEEMKEILTELKKSSKRRSRVAKNEDNKENVPAFRQGKSPASILTSSKKKDLRIDVLKKTVSFNMSTKKVEKALEWYDMMKSSCSILQTPKFQTPKRMKRHLSDKVQLQCLMLQDTPQHI